MFIMNSGVGTMSSCSSDVGVAQTVLSARLETKQAETPTPKKNASKAGTRKSKKMTPELPNDSMALESWIPTLTDAAMQSTATNLCTPEAQKHIDTLLKWWGKDCSEKDIELLTPVLCLPGASDLVDKIFAKCTPVTMTGCWAYGPTTPWYKYVGQMIYKTPREDVIRHHPFRCVYRKSNTC
jgi:hypothetical protein